MPEERKKIDELVEASGMITHFKSTNILRANGWSVLVSPYYHDSISDSIRETDLIAEKQFNSSRNPMTSSTQINVQLFIECKYLKQDIAFWFDKINKDKAVASMEVETELAILHNKFSADIGWDKFHYSRCENVAKLFSTNSNKEDVMYKAMNQCLHSQINYRRTGKKVLVNKFSGGTSAQAYIVQYPIIVCDNFSKLQEVRFEEGGDFLTETLKDHFTLETNYREDYFLIDIVDINYLKTFLDGIEQEAHELINAHS